MWEAHATCDLRHACPQALEAYERHGRLHDGTRDAMFEAAYQAWLRDRANGLDAVLLAGDNATVPALNARARTDRILTGQVTADGVALRDKTIAGTGDIIVTQLNARGITDRPGMTPRKAPCKACAPSSPTWSTTSVAPENQSRSPWRHGPTRASSTSASVNNCTASSRWKPPRRTSASISTSSGG